MHDRYHRLLDKSPYVLLYGQKPRVKMKELPYDLQLCEKLQTEGKLKEPLGVENLVKGYKEKDNVEHIDDEADDEEVLCFGLQKSVILKPVQPGNVNNISVISIKFMCLANFECTESYLCKRKAFCAIKSFYCNQTAF